MAKINTGGGAANKSGNILEKTVSSVFVNNGFQELKYGEWIKAPRNYSEELILRNAPYQNIYKHNGKSEFLLKSKHYDLEVRIECKWQQSSGSVDEKFPYLYLNCIMQMPENSIIIIADGNGARSGAVAWLKNACDSKFLNTDKDVRVLSLAEFIVWSNKIFR